MKKLIGVRLPVDLYNRLEDFRWQARQSKQDVIIKALREHLDREEENERNARNEGVHEV